MLNPQQQQQFVEEGYMVIPQVVPSPLLHAARQAIQQRAASLSLGLPGPHHSFLTGDLPTPLTDLLFGSPAITIATSLIAPHTFEPLDHVQIALTTPPWPHRPGMPHVDGLTPPEPDGRPSTFTLLAGFFLSDQSANDSGNLWVWPGSYRLAASYLRQVGPDALSTAIPYPPVALPEPRQVTGKAGDLLLAHYLLGHNTGGNTSDQTRETVYFRLRSQGHREHWREFVQDPLLEFAALRPGDNRS